MKMLFERLLTLKSGRSVKVTASEVTDINTSTLPIAWDILVKDPQEAHFRPLIENSHPIFWKLKRLSPYQRKLAELEYSGINKTDIRKIIKELRKTSANQFQKN